MKPLVALILLIAAGCGPKCTNGHDEMVTIPGHTYTTYTYIRIRNHSISIPHQNWVPEHQENRFVCDQYEARR